MEFVDKIKKGEAYSGTVDNPDIMINVKIID